MTLTDWFNKRKMQQIAARDNDIHIDDSIGKLWTLCYNCSSQLPKKDLENNLMVCPNCDYHFRIGARDRIKLIADKDTFQEMYQNIKPDDPLEFVDTQSYKSRQAAAKEKSGLEECVIFEYSGAILSMVFGKGASESGQKMYPGKSSLRRIIFSICMAYCSGV